MGQLVRAEPEPENGSAERSGTSREGREGREGPTPANGPATSKSGQPKGRTKGKQVYLGGYAREEEAARAYDKAAIKYWGARANLNFPRADYASAESEIAGTATAQYVAQLRRGSTGFSRGASRFRGVTRHHQHGRWEARIGRVLGNRYLYLGTFASEEEAARAYDVAALRHRGPKAVTNFARESYYGNDDQTPVVADEGPRPPASGRRETSETSVLGGVVRACCSRTQATAVSWRRTWARVPGCSRASSPMNASRSWRRRAAWKGAVIRAVLLA